MQQRLYLSGDRMKGAHWDKDIQAPDPQLIAFLEAKADSIQQRIRADTGYYIHKPVYYSAKYGYNLQVLLDFIIDHIPWRRKNL